MHEFEFANKIIKEAKKYGRVKSICVEVGELAPIGLKDLEKVLKRMANFDVKMISKKGLVKCGCNYAGKPKIIERQLLTCPRCGRRPKILAGGKIKLKEVERE